MGGTIIFIHALSMFAIVISVRSVLDDTPRPILSQFAHSIAFLVYIFLTLWLNISFCIKLNQVQKASAIPGNEYQDEDKEKTLNIITKLTILCLWSSITLLIFMGTLSIRMTFPHSTYLRFVHILSVTNDLCSNFLSVYLSNTYFTDFYFKICGCCHSKCLLCARKWVDRNKSNKRDDVELQIKTSIEISAKETGSKQSDDATKTEGITEAVMNTPETTSPESMDDDITGQSKEVEVK